MNGKKMHNQKVKGKAHRKTNSEYWPLFIKITRIGLWLLFNT